MVIPAFIWKRGKEVLIIWIYQYCKSDGPNTDYQQQNIMHSENNLANPDPRKHFRQDLINLIKEFKEKNEDIVPIILGDWNEEFTDTSTSMRIWEEFNLVNVFQRMYPNQEKFKTYRRGSSTIDFVLAPPNIADAVTNFVYEPFLYRLKGDHRAFYFDIPENVLFGNDIKAPFDPNSRDFHSKDIKI